MTSIPLITSIPPLMFRLDGFGSEIGEAYQKSCIASWRRSGFEPISINSAVEDYKHSPRMIAVDRDASGITGRPHVYFSDMLEIASAEAQGPFALTNADIMLPAGSDLAAKVVKLRPGELILSRRLDVDEPGRTDGRPYRYGLISLPATRGTSLTWLLLAWCSALHGGTTFSAADVYAGLPLVSD
jgi:hypothetical protein